MRSTVRPTLVLSVPARFQGDFESRHFLARHVVERRDVSLGDVLSERIYSVSDASRATSDCWRGVRSLSVHGTEDVTSVYRSVLIALVCIVVRRKYLPQADQPRADRCTE